MNILVQPKMYVHMGKQRKQKQSFRKKRHFAFSFQGDAMTLQLHQKSTNKGNKEPNC